MLKQTTFALAGLFGLFAFGATPSALAGVTASADWSQTCQLGCTGSADGSHHAHVGPGEGDLFVNGGWADGCSIPLAGGSCSTHADGFSFGPGDCMKATATTDAANGHAESVAGNDACDDLQTP